MFKSDTTRVALKQFRYDQQREANAQLRIYKQWFDERNIKYSFYNFPAWVIYPVAAILRNEDALAFKLAFNI